MGTQTALIFGAMPCGSWGHLDALRAEKPLVICADGGVHCAAAAWFAPDCYVGDGDSGGTAVAGAENILLRPEKDESDLQAAYTMARRMAVRACTSRCTGGRLDHALANLQLLETARADGVEAILLDPDNRVTCIGPGEYTLPRTEYFYFSLLPIDAVLRGVTIEGAKYPLRDAEARRGDSLTISNEWIEPTVRLRIREGLCWLICSGAAAR